MQPREALRQYFGHSDFRRGQRKLIEAVLGGRDVLGVMPTGGGKSMCYQIPALCLGGTTLVISPLISLMKDQVAALTDAGVPAGYINSSLSGEELRDVYRRAYSGEYRLLYVAPERLGAPGFVKLAQTISIPLIAVDEANCISQWGQDFRPSYLEIADFIDALPQRPVTAAFTATATARVQEDIGRLLRLRGPLREVTGFDRPNLYFEVRTPRSKNGTLLALVRERVGRCGIVYCATRAAVERVCQSLQDAGIPATRYHAGLDEEERRRNQDDFQFDRRTVMVATNAFGMGIDKSNVSYVIHYNMPKSLEAYYQEAGRAGRDGEPADCILLFAPADVETARFLIDNGGSDALSEEEAALVRRRDMERLQAMVGYCRTAKCLRGYILDYFGQPHADACGSCGNCRAKYRAEDITTHAQMILSCAVRIRDALGYGVGKTLLIQVLRGSRDQRVLQLRLDKLPTYGLLAELPESAVRARVEYLEMEGYLKTDPDHGARLRRDAHHARAHRAGGAREGRGAPARGRRPVSGAARDEGADCAPPRRPGVCRVLGCDAHGYGAPRPAHDGGFSRGVRRRADEGQAVRRGVSGDDRGARGGEVTVIFRQRDGRGVRPFFWYTKSRRTVPRSPALFCQHF